MENSNSIIIGTKMCGANLQFLDVNYAKKNKKNNKQTVGTLVAVSVIILRFVVSFQHLIFLAPSH